MSAVKKMRRFAALALALALAMTLAACRKSGLSTFDAKVYVEGLLKETYLGEFDEGYMTLVDITEAEAEATYQNSLEVEAANFCYFYDIEYPTEEFNEKLQDLYGRIYAHARFEVISAAEQDDGSFSVKLSIEPINIVQLAEAKFEDTMEPFYTKYPVELQDTMSDEEYEAMDQEYGQMILDLYESVMAEIGNEEAQTLSVQLEKNEEGYYSLTEDDFGRIDKLIINYSVAPAGE